MKLAFFYLIFAITGLSSFLYFAERSTAQERSRLAQIANFDLTGKGKIKEIPRQIEAYRKVGVVFDERRPFKSNAQSLQGYGDLTQTVKDGAILTLDRQAVNDLIAEQPEFLSLAIPNGSDSLIELELMRATILAPGFYVETSDGKKITDDKSFGIHYRGIIKGDVHSLASISIYENEVMGLFSTVGSGNFVLGRLGGTNLSNDHILYEDTDLLVRPERFCDVETPNGISIPTVEAPADSDEALVRCVRMYLETNFNVFQNKGSVAAVNSFVTGFFNQSATLMANAGVATTLSQIFVWTSPSPYTGTDSATQLANFRATRTTFNGNLAHLVDLQNIGGRAYVDVYCNPSFAYAYSGIFDFYNNVPTYSWTVNVFSHEAGHNLGSPHTHACAWNGNNTAIDGCFTVEGTCAQPGAPAGGGTIMSYCHNNPVGINLSLGYGPQPSSLILSRFNAASCLTDCGGPVGSVQLSSSTYSIGEGAGSLVVTITRTGGTGAFNVNYTTANGTALAGSDYTATSGTMSFAAADTSRTFSVPIINDSLVEGTETFSVSLNSPTNGATLGSPSSATVSIIDNDTSCTYSLNPTNLTFGSSGGSGSFSVNTQAGCSWATSVNAPLTEIRENRENLFLSEVKNSPDGDAPQIAPQAVFLNSTPITVADRTSSTSAPGLGSPYPSNISVSGMTGTITSVDLSLNGVTHTFPADLDVILVGPGGQRVLVMSDAGAGNDISNTNLTISGSASTAMTSTGTITSGTYLPSNYAGNTTIEPGGIDNFPAPGPGSANHPTALSVFNGLAANGTWSLYVVDDESVDVGSINGGWALGITTTGGGSGWISITSGSSGTGSGTVNYSVSMNTGSAQRTGSITAGGQTHTVTQNGVVSGIRKPYDFDGDSRSDMSIYRPSNGQWWWMRSSNGVSGAVTFGSSTDIITPGDFTGDNRADHAFFRPSTGFWYVLRSENFSFYAGQFGTNGDIPAPGDFDADGRDDLTVFRPSNSTWYSLLSNGGTAINQFGSAGDRPVTGDYDGDGRADRAIFRPALGQWWIQRTTLGTVAYSFGVSTDRTTVGDHTGDGKADVAFFRPSTGTWYVLRSENNSFYAFPFGLSTDVPTPGDYDGDGKTDGAVFRPSNNTWYINRSSGGTTIQLFGAAGDTAVPSAFVR